MSNIINYSEFENVDIRLGTIVKAYEYKELKKPSIILEIDFGEIIGIKKTSAQILKHYSPDKILGKQIAAVINFKPKQIGTLISEVLVLGFPDNDFEPILIIPDKIVKNGGSLY